MNETASSPSKTRRFQFRELTKYALSAIIVAAGLGSMIALSKLAQSPGNVKPDSLVPQVRVYPAQSYSGQLDIEVSGTVVPFREIRIAAEVGGRVVKKYPACEAGNYVTAGTKLMEIDREDLEIQKKTTELDIKQAEKSIDEVDSEINGAQANLDLAIKDLELQQQDYERSERLRGSISQSELNAAARNLNAAQRAVTQQQSTISNLQARKERLLATLDLTRQQLKKIELDLARTLIVAPADGVIVKEMTEKDNIVRVGDELLLFEDIQHAEILCNLTTTDLDWLRQNSPESMETIETPGNLNVYHLPKTSVTVRDSANPSISWEGILERFDGIGRDEVTKTFPCRIVVKDPVIETDEGPRALVRGMYVKCQIEVIASAGQDERRFLTFPTRSLWPGNYAWVVRDNRLQKVDVEVVDHTVGRYRDNPEEPFVIVRQSEGGLQPGDEVVSSPLTQPNDEVLVEINREENDTSKPPSAVNETADAAVPSEATGARATSTPADPVLDDRG